MTARTANLQSDFTARLPWTAPVVRELFRSEAFDRRAEFDDPPASPPVASKSEIAVQPPARPLKHLPHIVADLRAADVLERHARELLNEAAELRARAAGEAPGAAEELVDVGTIAQALRISKSAARMQMIRSGYAAKVGGLWHVPRSAVSTLYRQRNVSVPQRNVSPLNRTKAAYVSQNGDARDE
jgi:hypothetical protein